MHEVLGLSDNSKTAPEARKCSKMCAPRVLIADDHRLVAELCKGLLQAEFDVVGTVGDGRALVRAAITLKPDAIVVDIAMPILNGLDAIDQVIEELPEIKLLILTMHKDAELVTEAFRRGASGYVLKTCAASELVGALRDVLRGKTYVSRTLQRNDLFFSLRQPKRVVRDRQPLTGRQREVLQLIAEGKVMKEIGDTLNMATRTVAFHKYRIMETLGVKSSAELVRYAVRNHIVAD